MPTFECPRSCHLNDHGGRCPRCGTWMKSHGTKPREEVMAEVVERQRQAAPQLATDTKRLDNSYTRAFKEKMKQEEIKYFNQR